MKGSILLKLYLYHIKVITKRNVSMYFTEKNKEKEMKEDKIFNR